MNTAAQMSAAKVMAIKAAELSKLAARAHLAAVREHGRTLPQGLPDDESTAQKAADLATDALDALNWS